MTIEKGKCSGLIIGAINESPNGRVEYQITVSLSVRTGHLTRPTIALQGPKNQLAYVCVRANTLVKCVLPSAASQSFLFSSKMLRYLINGLVKHLLMTFRVPRRCMSGDPSCPVLVRLIL